MYSQVIPFEISKRSGKVYVLRYDQQIVTGSNHRSKKGLSMLHGTSVSMIKELDTSLQKFLRWCDLSCVFSDPRWLRKVKEENKFIVYTHSTTSERERGLQSLFFRPCFGDQQKEHMHTYDQTRRRTVVGYLPVEDQLSQPEALWPRFYNTPVDLTPAC